MQANSFQLGLIVGGACAINAGYALKHESPVATILVAHGLMYVVLSFVGDLSGYMELSQAFAIVFLLGSLLARGGWLIDQFTK